MDLICIVSLKEDNPDLAWNSLIEAQGLISTAIQNHPYDSNYLLGYANRLYDYEKIYFPEMKFASASLVIGSSSCSICHKEYRNCDHIKGRAYMGKICCEVVNKIADIEEVSLVDNPADKSCRVFSFTENGKEIDSFTHREVSN